MPLELPAGKTHYYYDSSPGLYRKATASYSYGGSIDKNLLVLHIWNAMSERCTQNFINAWQGDDSQNEHATWQQEDVLPWSQHLSLFSTWETSVQTAHIYDTDEVCTCRAADWRVGSLMNYCDASLQLLIESPLPISTTERITLLDKAAAQGRGQNFVHNVVIGKGTTLTKQTAKIESMSNTMRQPHSRADEQFLATLR